MKIIYQAFDGTQFDNEFECEDYEWKKNHEESLKNLIFYDKDGKVMLGNKLSEDIYSKVMKIEALSNNAVQAIQDIANYTGFLCYSAIKEVGIWEWNNEDEKFKKIFKIGVDI